MQRYQLKYCFLLNRTELPALQAFYHSYPQHPATPDIVCVRLPCFLRRNHIYISVCGRGFAPHITRNIACTSLLSPATSPTYIRLTMAESNRCPSLALVIASTIASQSPATKIDFGFTTGISSLCLFRHRIFYPFSNSIWFSYDCFRFSASRTKPVRSNSSISL